MNTYLVSFDLNNGKCFVPCPHLVTGVTGCIVMLGSAFCRENCLYHGKYEAKKYDPGIPVKCLYDQKKENINDL